MRLDTLDAPRRAFLTARTTIDVSACPGSGKTTLIVAKLAILAAEVAASNQRHLRPLSHERSARGNSATSRQYRRRTTLLSYPHFIDTIHGFVNRFLALPWLNSNGYPSPTIDNDLTTAFRRGVLSKLTTGRCRIFSRKSTAVSTVCASAPPTLASILAGRRSLLGRTQTPSSWRSRLSRKLPKRDTSATMKCLFGLVRFWRTSRRSLHGSGSGSLSPFSTRCRTHLNSKARCFMRSFLVRRLDIVVQRVGDPNQAIFDDSEAEPNKIDLFPDRDIARCLSIPNSYRFGQQIAALASPFAVSPVGLTGLSGIGPKAVEGMSDTCAPAIFIFPGDNTAGVLDAYGKHVLTIFDDRALATGSLLPSARCIRMHRMLRRDTRIFRNPSHTTGAATPPKSAGRSLIPNFFCNVFGRHGLLCATVGISRQVSKGLHQVLLASLLGLATRGTQAQRANAPRNLRCVGCKRRCPCSLPPID